MNGYIQIDCTGLDLIKGSTEQSITGLYAKVQAAYSTNKPIYAVNCNWDGTPVTPVQTFAIPFDGYFICTSATLQIIIRSTDIVTIVNLVE